MLAYYFDTDLLISSPLFRYLISPFFAYAFFFFHFHYFRAFEIDRYITPADAIFADRYADYFAFFIFDFRFFFFLFFILLIIFRRRHFLFFTPFSISLRLFCYYCHLCYILCCCHAAY